MQAGGGGAPYTNRDSRVTTLQVNLWGAINTTQAFTQAMIDQGTDCLMIHTAGKQGVPCPPDNTAYEVSEAGVRALTEGLQRHLRDEPGGKVTAALLVPGWVNIDSRNPHPGGADAGTDR